jgi:arylsulfatase A-like enzyme
VGLLWLALALGAAPASGAEPVRPNVVMFFIDTLRADHVHCYGYERETSPSLDALAARGTLFQNAIAQSSWSLPSYASMFTSLYSSAHHVDEKNQKLAPSLKTLASIFSANGYATAAFVGGSHLSAIFGLDAGFDLYSDRPHFGSLFHTVPPALQWLKEHQRKPFFLMVQGYDAHIPYQVPLGFGEMWDPGYQGLIHDLDVLKFKNVHRIADGVFYYPTTTGNGKPMPEAPESTDSMEPVVPVSAPIASVALAAKDHRHIVAHYDGAVSYADTWLGYFLERLKAQGLADNTVVLVAGDHGEALGEQGYYRHRWDLYESQIHVPLVFAGPGIAAGRQIPDVVELVDLAPTLLALCGLPPYHAHQGRRLNQYLAPGQEPPRDPSRVAISTLSNCLSARTERWHLLHWSDNTLLESRGLYDLTTDPTEQHNLARQQPAVLQQLESALKDWKERTFRPAPETGKATLTAEEQEMFREGGYW